MSEIMKTGKRLIEEGEYFILVNEWGEKKWFDKGSSIYNVQTLRHFVRHEESIGLKLRIIENIYYKAQKMLDENRLWGSVYEHKVGGISLVAVEINHGDWKHEHLRCKWLFKEKLGATHMAENVTYEDGSDNYSAIHYFYIPERVLA